MIMFIINEQAQAQDLLWRWVIQVKSQTFLLHDNTAHHQPVNKSNLAKVV